MKLDGAVAVVIGGARGIGKAYCVSLLDHNTKVCCADVLDETGRETETELRQKYGEQNIYYTTCDGTNEQQVRDTLRSAKQRHGRLDIVVNNVGIVDETNWEKVINVNLGTTVRVTNAVLELLGKDKGGSGGVLVHTASNGGLVPAFYCPVYCATKAAMIAYVRSWTHQLNYCDHGVRMFTLCPKLVDTPFITQNLDKTRVLKLEVLLKVLNPADQSSKANNVLRPEWVAETLIRALEDDSVNGCAIQLLSRDPIFHFVGPNDQKMFAESVQK